MGSGPRRLLGEVRRRLLLRRRWLAAAAAAGAVVLGVQAARPAAPHAVVVWTAAHDLAGGSVVGAGDLRGVGLAAELVPSHVASRRLLLGGTLMAPVAAGRALTDLDVVGPRMVGRYGGRTVAPVRIADAGAAALLRPGDRIDLVAGDPSGDGSGRVVSTGAVVVTVPAATPAAAGGPTGRLVLVAVSPADATAVTLAGLAGLLGVTWTH